MDFDFLMKWLKKTEYQFRNALRISSIFFMNTKRIAIRQG